MKLFERRPLAFVCSVYILSSLLGFILSSAAKIIIIAVLLYIFITMSAIRLFTKKKIKARYLVGVLFCCVALVISYSYFDVRYASFREYDGRKCYVEGIVLEERYGNDSSVGYYVRLKNINFTDVDCKAMLDCKYQSGLCEGNYFKASVVFEGIRYEEREESSELYYIADGALIRLTSENEDDIFTVSEQTRDLMSEALKIRMFISDRIKLYVGGKAGILASALFSGDKTQMPSEIRRDFTFIGVSHILALSGLHIAIIVSVADKILYLTGFGKKARSIVIAVFIMGFMIITGMSPSIMRAAIMMTIVCLGTVLSENGDTLTSLAFAGCVILAFSPQSVADVGFWLTILATFGIIVSRPVADACCQYLYVQKDGVRRRSMHRKSYRIFASVMNVVINLTVTTFGANIGICIVSWLFYDRLTFMTFLSNMLIVPVSTVVIVLTFLLVLSLPVPFFTDIIARLVYYASSVTIGMAEKLSTVKGAEISLRFAFAGYIIIGMTAVYLIMLVSDIKNKMWFTLPVVTAFAVFTVCLSVCNVTQSDKLTTIYLRNGKNETLVMTAKDSSVIVDMTDGSYTYLSDAVGCAYGKAALKTETLILTRYSTKHRVSVKRLLSEERIGQLWLPYPVTEEQYLIMASMTDNAISAGCRVSLYKSGEECLIFDGGKITLYDGNIDRSVRNTEIINIEYGDDSLCYVSPAVNESGIADIARECVSSAQNVIFGISGPVVHTKYGYCISGVADNIIFADKTLAAYYDMTDDPEIEFTDSVIILEPEYYEIILEK